MCLLFSDVHVYWYNFAILKNIKFKLPLFNFNNNNPLGLLILNRRTGRYAPNSTVASFPGSPSVFGSPAAEIIYECKPGKHGYNVYIL